MTDLKIGATFELAENYQGKFTRFEFTISCMGVAYRNGHGALDRIVVAASVGSTARITARYVALKASR